MDPLSRPVADMPRASQLTQEEVFEAIAELLADGEYPTSARLREALDHRGSPVVLQRLLSAWYEKFGPSLAAAASAVRPAVVGADLRSQLESATRQALAEFDRAQAERLAQLEDREAAADAVDASLQARAQALDEREMAQRELIEELRAAARVAESRRASSLQLYARARAERDTARGSAAALAEQLADAQRQAVDVAALQAALSHARGTAEREAARVVEVAKERDDARAQAKAALADASGLRLRLDAERDAHAAARVDLAGARAAADASQQQAALLAKQHEDQRAAARMSHSSLVEHLERLQGRLDTVAESASSDAREVAGQLGRVHDQLADQARRLETMASHVQAATPSPENTKRRSRRDTAKASSDPT